jgi:hypothetical protein
MRGAGTFAVIVAVAVVGCNSSDEPQSSHPATSAAGPPLAACAEAWNGRANFGDRTAGATVRRLEQASAEPLFAHLSRDHLERCVVFVDTMNDVDDRRFVRVGGRFEVKCKGPCGDQAPVGAQTFRFREDGSLPSFAGS